MQLALLAVEDVAGQAVASLDQVRLAAALAPIGFVVGQPQDVQG